MAKRKSKKHEQQAIAEEAVSSQTRMKLKRQIATLKRLPKDFRDIIAGTNDWEAFATITGRRKEMEAWDNGPILYFGELNASEKSILGSQSPLVAIERHKTLTAKSWKDVLVVAIAIEASWLYLPDEGTKIITALNILFSRFEFNIRAKGQLLSEHTGKPVGVVR